MEAGSCDEKKEEIIGNINKTVQAHLQMTEKKRQQRNMSLRESMFDGENVWLLKPADANRGRGVHLFNSLDQMKRLLVELTSRAESKQFQHFAQNTLKLDPPAPNLQDNNQMSAAQAQDDGQGANNQPVANIKSDVFVIQKYIERPLLISKRKFDIRLWVLVTHEHKCFYFREGYVRMSSQRYDLSQADNLMVHLTNNAIQKHGDNYGQFEEGNILSFQQASVSVFFSYEIQVKVSGFQACL